MLRTAVTILCGAGLYVSLFMLRKSRMADRGNVDGSSIVKESHARLFLGKPNSLFGSLYFPLIAAAVWIYPWLVAQDDFDASTALRWLILLSVATAAATSLFLAYSLLFVTKRGCPYCWAAHVVNWVLLFMVPLSIS